MERGYKAALDLTLLQDWCDFCNGKRHFDRYHFSTLLVGVFLEGLTPEVDDFLRRFSGHFPDSLYAHLKRICGQPTDGDVLPWVKRDLREKRKLLEKCDSNEGAKAIALIDSESYSFTHKRDTLCSARQSQAHLFLYDVVVDFVWDTSPDNEQFSALVDALYHIATDCFVAYSIVAPLLNTNINLANYFEVYVRGGDYVLADDHILVYTYDPDVGGSV